MPFWVLYRLSDILYFVIYYLVGYRKKVVRTNLCNSFPAKNQQERRSIEKKFYRHFCDLIVESVKLFSISKKEINKRFTIQNPELINQYARNNQSVILVGGHYNNWEILAVGISQQIELQAVGLYSKLKNDFFNRIMLQSRGKYGLRLVSTRETSSYFLNESHKNTVTIFGADQSPTHSKTVYWMDFLNQETAVATGTERFAKLYNYPVIFGAISKVKRGYYSFKMDLISDNPSVEPLEFITQKHTSMLEKQIKDLPEYWLWTHKRWKRKKNS